MESFEMMRTVLLSVTNADFENEFDVET